jgi:hypothetical protein
MEPPLVILVVLVVAALLVARTLVRRRAREKAEREPQVPTMPKVIAAALLGAAFLAIGVTILVTTPDLSQGDGSGRYGWMPAWIQAAVLLIGGLGFEYLAVTNLRKLREHRRRGADAAAFDPLAADTDVVNEPRP